MYILQGIISGAEGFEAGGKITANYLWKITGWRPQAALYILKTARIYQVLFREHYTWQGRPNWKDRNQEVIFHSVIELIKLLDEVLGE